MEMLGRKRDGEIIREQRDREGRDTREKHDEANGGDRAMKRGGERGMSNDTGG